MYTIKGLISPLLFEEQWVWRQELRPIERQKKALNTLNRIYSLLSSVPGAGLEPARDLRLNGF